METSFYPDDGYGIMETKKTMKRPMTLDLQNSGKKARFQPVSGLTPLTTPGAGVVLSSPDLQMLKLPTPELEKFIIQNGGNPLPTPAGNPSPYMFGKTVTEAQENYARGFVDALDALRRNDVDDTEEDSEEGDVTSDSQQSDFSSSNTASDFGGIFVGGGGVQYQRAVTTTVSGGSFSGIVGCQAPVVKEEPQIVPSLGCCSSSQHQSYLGSGSDSTAPTPPHSPIDMKAQEKIKLERKRQRNRIAASKCRRRKLERIAKLEDKVNLLKGENTELSSIVTKLRDHIAGLKQQLVEHRRQGCRISLPENNPQLHDWHS